MLSWAAYLFSACLWFVYGLQKRDKDDLPGLHRLDRARRSDHHWRHGPSLRPMGVDHAAGTLDVAAAFSALVTWCANTGRHANCSVSIRDEHVATDSRQSATRDFHEIRLHTEIGPHRNVASHSARGSKTAPAQHLEQRDGVGRHRRGWRTGVGMRRLLRQLGRLHPPSEAVSEPEPGGAPSYASRSATKQYRTAPLKGLWQHAPYFHNGTAPTLDAVIQTYNTKQSLGLTAAQISDLTQYLKSL